MSNFKIADFKCPCCNKNNIEIDIVTIIQRARQIADIPIVINSAYRCKRHNKDVGGKTTSSHLKGLALDIKCSDSMDRLTLVNAFVKVGVKRIGIADTFIHIDIDSSKLPCIWLY